MSVVADTSALYAIVDACDARHAAALDFARLQAGIESFVVTNYVVSEALSLVSRRLGMDAARALQRGALQSSDILWTTPLEHAAGIEAFLASGRSPSFVDCATMATMRSRGLDTIFTFDDDFAQAGFATLPSPA